MIIGPAAVLLSAAPFVFSAPIPIAETATIAPPALVIVDDAVHVFWLDRPPGAPPATGDLWHAAASVGGRPLIDPHRIGSGADTRFGWPAAARAGAGLVVAWMQRSDRGVRLQATVLGTDGHAERTISPSASTAEEGGRISILAWGDRIHLAWSQYAAGERHVWYVRLRPDGRTDSPGRALGPGDAPALAARETLSVLWWRTQGPVGDALYAGTLTDALELADVRQLTGPVQLATPIPPLPLSGPGSLDVLIPTTERAFRTSGQLYLVRMRGSEVTARLPLSRGRPLSDVSAVPAGLGALVVWSEPAGRRQNAEIFSATYDAAVGQLSGVSRVTYTAAGSLRPAVAAVGDGAVAGWLETLDIARFRVVMGTTRGARPPAFLLGTPELDRSRPGPLVVFAATVIASTLPYAALFAAVFSLGSLAVLFLARAVLRGLGDRLIEREPARLAAFLCLVLALQLLGRGLIPGVPTRAVLAASLALPAAAAVAWVSARGRDSGIGLLAAAAAVLLLQMTIVLFPWGVRQLSQL